VQCQRHFVLLDGEAGLGKVTHHIFWSSTRLLILTSKILDKFNVSVTHVHDNDGRCRKNVEACTTRTQGTAITFTGKYMLETGLFLIRIFFPFVLFFMETTRGVLPESFWCLFFSNQHHDNQSLFIYC